LKVLDDKITAVLLTRRSFVWLHALGYAALSAIMIRHSLPWLRCGALFPDLGYDPKRSAVPIILQNLVLVYLFALYFLSLAHWPRLHFKVREMFWIGGLLAGIMWLALPANSTDIFAYIGLGRMAAVYGVNPYLHTYAEFEDFFSVYLFWKLPMPYGPVVLPVFILAGWLSQVSLFLSIYALKLVWLLVHGSNSWLLYRILKSWKPAAAPYSLFLFAFNPLVLLEQIGNAHMDGLLILFSLLAILALQRERHSVALWMALLAALVKLPGLLLCAAIFVYLMRQREWRGIFWGMIGGVVMLAALKLTVFPNLESLMSMVTSRLKLTQNSLHTWLIDVVKIFSQKLGIEASYPSLLAMDRKISTVLFALFCLWRLGRIRDFGRLRGEMALVLLVLLIGYTEWFFPWYATWLLPFAALTESRPLQRVIIVYSATVLALDTWPYFAASSSALPGGWGALGLAIAQGIPLALMIRYWKFQSEESELVRS